MQINLAYGKNGLLIDLDDQLNITILEPENVTGMKHGKNALKYALQNPINSLPLSKIATKDKSVGIIFNDITRATPNHLILQAVLDELKHVPSENITFFNALGTHRDNTDAELRSLVSDYIVDNYKIIQNNCTDKETQEYLGKSLSGNDIYINKALMKCDIKILTGFIEPHFFAGFSGGGKAIMPGMAGLDTILINHGAKMIDNPNSIWGEIDNNPLQQEVRQIAKKAGADFIVNVTMNNNHEITNVFAGDLETAHNKGCKYVRETAMKPVDEPFDIVLTTNSGYPLDQNLYQSVKGMSGAAKIVKEGGAIIIASECSDGVPDHGLYKKMLIESKNPDDVLDTVRCSGVHKQDQWQAQVQALVQKKADVYVYSDYLSSELLESLLLKSCDDIKNTINSLLQKYGKNARICVLPQGPLTIPYISNEKIV